MKTVKEYTARNQMQ